MAVGLAAATVLAYAARTFATRPALESDSWAVWLAKARLLYADASAAPAALRSGNYGPTPYPIGLRTFEALGFKEMGGYDSTVISVQFYLLAGGAAWIASRGSETWLLGCFAIFLGLAGLIKSEGFLFALAGCVALAVAVLAARNHALTAPVAKAIGAVLVLILPWLLYCSAYGLTTPDYDLRHAVDPSYLSAHADRVGPAAGELWFQLTKTQSWGLLVWVILLALASGLVARQWPLLTFAATWLGLAAGGLLLTYWISTLPVTSHLSNSSDRTIVSLLIGGAAVVPLFVFPRAADE